LTAAAAAGRFPHRSIARFRCKRPIAAENS